MNLVWQRVNPFGEAHRLGLGVLVQVEAVHGELPERDGISGNDLEFDDVETRRVLLEPLHVHAQRRRLVFVCV